MANVDQNIQQICGTKQQVIVCPKQQSAEKNETKSAEGRGTGAGCRFIPYLKNCRESLAEYQEKKGIARDQTFTFFALVYMIAQYMYSILLAMLTMVLNLSPLLDAALLIFRFLIDKLIEVLEAENNTKIFKIILLIVEFIALVLILLIMYGLILSPLSSLFIVVIAKLWNFIY